MDVLYVMFVCMLCLYVCMSVCLVVFSEFLFFFLLTPHKVEDIICKLVYSASGGLGVKAWPIN